MIVFIIFFPEILLYGRCRAYLPTWPTCTLILYLSHTPVMWCVVWFSKTRGRERIKNKNENQSSVESNAIPRRDVQYFSGLSVRITARWVLHSITLAQWICHILYRYYTVLLPVPSFLLLYEDLKARIVPISARRVIYNNMLNRIV